MKVVFIAGRFRAETQWGIVENVRRAERDPLEVWRLGAAALCPHTNTANFHGAAPDEVFLEGVRELLRRSDAALFLEGWTDSSGSVKEHLVCRDTGIPIFYSLDELKAWLKAEAAIEKTIDEDSLATHLWAAGKEFREAAEGLRADAIENCLEHFAEGAATLRRIAPAIRRLEAE